MANKSNSSNQTISLPQGGGSVKGIGETFQPNLFSGTGNFSVPIVTSPGRNGFGPQLTVQYSTGNGNGPFGLGWQLSIPRITRKTEKGLPTYTEDDIFVMSGAEDLVPYLKRVSNAPEQWARVERPQGEFTIRRYRLRTEGQFARIERWMRSDGDIHWRATTKENITSIYGRTPTARITDPEHPGDIFEWLLEETFDAKGNHILYEYVQEHPGLSLPGIHEHNRSYTQAYIRRILYGNTPDDLDPDKRGGPVRMTIDETDPLQIRARERHYLFEVLFDYGDIASALTIPQAFPSGPEVTIPNNWPVRDDPFSSFRSGFEIRTLRRCERVLMLHHFREGELEDAPLVKSTDFQYQNNPDTKLSFLISATVAGYRKDPANPQGYLRREMPPVSFTYSAFHPENQRYQSVTVTGRNFPPQSLSAPDFTVLDVFGNGLPDILQDTGAGFHFWENLGQGRLNLRRPQQGDQPIVSFTQPNVAIGDMGGDGLADLIVDAPPLSGFYESTPDGRWKAFQRFDTVPSFDLRDPNTRLVDLTGDGLSDVLMTRDSDFLWLRCLGEAGYADPRRIPRKHDLDVFPDVYFNDPAGRVRLADMTGDGLTDIVLVHDGRIDYWPNLGYGRFGRRITMAGTPRIGFGFDPRRLFLADLDGTGCADLVYVDRGQVQFWFNRSGNGWSETQSIKGTPPVTDITSLQCIDFYGTGTAALLWSYDVGQQPGDSNYKVLDFCGGQKPNLLVAMDNNMGATTRVQYAPSTKFYLEDKANGKPWNTSLPFPVQVLETSEVIDHISRTKLVTIYKYHHGYYDGQEREFRGFGRVDQFDTEFFDDFSGAGLHGKDAEFDNRQPGFHVPPIETRNWFHTGVYFDADRYVDFRELTEQYRGEYYRGDTEAFVLDEHSFRQADGKDGPGDTPHEAFRALRGAVLRTEVYARDASARADHPYAVTEHRYRVTALQPKDGNHHAVYLSHPLESLSYHYERNPADPRIGHTVTLEIDGFGNPLKALAIAYGRRQPDPALPTQADRDKQTRILITYTENDYTNAIDDPLLDPGNYLTPLPSEARTYELTGFRPVGDAKRFGYDEWVKDDFARLKNAPEIGYEETADSNLDQKRLIERVRTRYRRNDLTDLLPLGALQSLALSGESYKLAFTPGLVTQVYGARIEDAMLARDGGYVHSEGDANWWIPSGQVFYSPDVADTPAQELAFAQQHFFVPHRARDPFGNTAFTAYDPYDLLLTQTTDPLGNRISTEHDYRLLQPFRMTDPNGNRAEVTFDALGLVAGTAVMGKPTEVKGDSLSGFVPDLSSQQLQEFLADPLANAALLLGQATTRIVYDLDRYRTAQQPVFAATLARETHVSGQLPPQGLKIQIGFSYSDGFGREIQKKIQAEPGAAPQRDANGRIVVGPDGQPVMTTNDISPRWVGSGWTVFNNKGKPVRQYEPFFTDTHRFEFDVRIGVSPVLFYDPVERVAATLHPNHTYEKVVFDPWQQTSYDVNDTVAFDPGADGDVKGFFIDPDSTARLPVEEYLPTWYALRTDPGYAIEFAARYPDAINRANETSAATKAAAHANTPATVYFDTLGRPFLTVAHNKVVCLGHDLDGTEEKFHTRVELDIEGNQRAVLDERKLPVNGLPIGALEQRVVMRYDYDMLGNRIHQASMEAGERWMLNDMAGKPLYAWDSRDHQFRTAYDPLRRPTDAFLREGANNEIVVGRRVYGESRPNPEASNLRGKVVQVFDQAGVVTSDDYDFKGNLLRGQRQLAQEYKTILDWAQSPALEVPVFTTSTVYDALNRPVTMTTPDNSVVHPVYNEANLLERLGVNLRGAVATTPFVANLDYNAKGQRELIEYGNGVSTTYEYDRETFRLTRLQTARASDQAALQDLAYTADPAGNITFIRDDAQQTIYFSNQRAEPSADYTYDAVYRLIEATGREHLRQAGGAPIPHSYNDSPRVGMLSGDGAGHFSPNDGQLMGTYLERYVYDAVGNFLSMRHIGRQPANPGWTRTYAYDEASLLEPAKQSNRLSSTSVGSGNPITERYDYDAHGNMLRMPHLPLMQWDYRDELQATAQQVVSNGGTPETTYYIYDASGQRVRKVIERQAPAGQTPTRMKERIYLGGFEVYREYDGGGATVTLERETLHVMDDKQRIALVETRTQGTDTAPQQLIRYQFSNHLGSASLELDDQAQIISYEEYSPYGSSTYQAVRSQTETPKRYRYTGMERDEESGLNYHGARYYATWVGRWVSSDPLGLSRDGTNVYSYVRNNPINYVDPSGLEGEENKGAFQWAKDEETNDDRHSRLTGIRKALLDHGWRRGQINEYFEKHDDIEILEHYGFEKVGRWSTKDPIKYAREAVDAINKYDYEWQRIHGLGQTSMRALTEADINTMEEAQRRREAIVAWFEGLEYVTSSVTAGAAAFVTSKITSDQRKITAAAGLGAAVGGAVGAGMHMKGQQGSYSPTPVTSPSPQLALPPGRERTPRGPGQTVDPLTGQPAGKFTVDPKGNVLIQPEGGASFTNPAGTFGETRYPNGSPYQQLHGPHARSVPDPHGHGFKPGSGVNQRGPSLDLQGNVVPEHSPAAHWPIKK